MVDSEKIIIDVYNDYCMYNDIYKTNRCIKQYDFNKIISIMYDTLKTKMKSKDVYRFFDYFIRLMLQDQMDGMKININYVVNNLDSVNVNLDNTLTFREDKFDIIPMKKKMIKEFNIKE